MKRLLPLLLALCLLTGCACSNEPDVLASLPRCRNRAYYSEGNWQDFTNYGVYRYGSLSDDILAQSLLKPVTAADLPCIRSYLDNHRMWVGMLREDSRLLLHYTFDAACLDAADWFLLRDKADTDSLYGPMDSYDLWLFDAQSGTLYFFHNNI